ncbi:TadE/TadG family type IV pilus assembly protein [Ruegeria arenilitoris]|uniref:TadE/TadG family type IV pilus assembly protein n=1 Tax=Ruegeria arenilitoris TaxID=1173585 RepID=UPI00147F945A|nr:TadE/TadG family type IV pilus assembly protein [Ruegeria arenilitoris]
MTRLVRHIRRLRSCEAGAPMVEFGIVLPLILLFFAVIIEGGRITWIHQATSAGVRDASRMIARIAPLDLCAAGGVGSYDALATDIVQNQLGGSSIMPHGTSVIDVTPRCISRAGVYRINPTSVVEVTAQIRIEYLFGNVFSLFGAALGPLDTEISDQSRVFGV